MDLYVDNVKRRVKLARDKAGIFQACVAARQWDTDVPKAHMRSTIAEDGLPAAVGDAVLGAKVAPILMLEGFSVLNIPG